MGEEEIPLAGGNLTRVVRVGNTVRRELKASSVTQHALLHHLEAQGFEAAPRFLGIDDTGREMLSFIPGDTGFVPYLYSEDVLIGAAKLLRRYHDATQNFVAPPNAVWMFEPMQPYEVICHGDFAPYNLMYANQRPTAIIDFDTIRPGPRVLDVSYAVYWFAPFQFEGDLRELSLSELRAGNPRLKKFCKEYGIQPSIELIAEVIARLQTMCNWLHDGAKRGDPVISRMVVEGHLQAWQITLEGVQAHRTQLEQNVT